MCVQNKSLRDGKEKVSQDVAFLQAELLNLHPCVFLLVITQAGIPILPSVNILTSSNDNSHPIHDSHMKKVSKIIKIISNDHGTTNHYLICGRGVTVTQLPP